MSDDAPVVRIAQGQVRGFWRDGRSAAFLGIPFAEAPVGEHRFAAPVPAAGWDGVRAATEFGPTPQRRPFGDVTAIPEPSFPGAATLNVNVFTPVPGEPDARLPVLVWIHGGGFKAGSPSSPWYDGLAFNRDGVVTVSISYRLGFDGFGWIPDAPHNRGLLDQIAALHWVQDNIAAFGGDPDRVTIAGQSAGGGSVWALLVSPVAKGLFSAAISHSGALALQPADVARRSGAALAELGGVEWTRAGLSRLSEEDVLDRQERVSVAPPPGGLDAALAGIFATGGIDLAFLPYVDGEVLPASVDDALAAGIGTDRPLVMGCTAHEFTAAGPMFAPLLAGEDLTAALARTRARPGRRGIRRRVPPSAGRRCLRARPAGHRPRLPGADGAPGRRAAQRHDLAVRLPAGAPRHRAEQPLCRDPVRLRLPGRPAGRHLLPPRPAPAAGRRHARRLGRVRPHPPGPVADVVRRG